MDPSSPAPQGTTPSSDHDPGHAWEEFVVASVYPEPGAKAKADYRNYETPTRDTVREFYRENHRHRDLGHHEGRAEAASAGTTASGSPCLA